MDAELERLRELKKNLNNQLEKFPYREYNDLHNFLRYAREEANKIMHQREKDGYWNLDDEDFN
jgi:hypothetical protein